MENKLIYGSVSGKKVDENGEGLGGALVGLFKSDDVEFTEEKCPDDRRIRRRWQLLL